MSKRTIGLLLNVLGVGVLILSLAADALGIGIATGIGWKQWLGAVVGVVIAASGFWFARSKSAK